MLKRLILIWLFCSTAFFLSVQAAGGSVGTTTWHYDESTGILTFSGQGAMPSYSPTLPWIEYQSEIKKVIIEEGITKITDHTFSCCFNLDEIIIADNNPAYTSTDGVLFDKERTELIWHPAKKADKTYVIPETVTTIGREAFNNCSSLTSVHIPASVKELGYNSFCRNLNLKEIIVDPGNAYYSSHNGVLFNKDQTILLIYPTGKQDGNYIVPSSVFRIENNAFGSCAYLTTIELPEGLTQIGNSAFLGCNLIAIHLPSTLSKVGGHTFSYCDKLTSISVDERNPYYSSQDGVLFNKNKTLIYVYPSGKKEATYTIPSTVETIKGFAFCSNNHLRRVDIPNGVTTIEGYAFYQARNLNTITIPGSVTYIGSEAFDSCLLAFVYVQNTTPPACELDAFDAESNCTLYVPEGSKPLYQMAKGWDVFSIILEEKAVNGSTGEIFWSFNEDTGTLTLSGQGAMPPTLEQWPWTEYAHLIKALIIEDGVTALGNYSFSFCDNLTSVVIPESVVRTGIGTFWYCSSLTSVYIPANLSLLGDHSFMGCYSLTEIVVNSDSRSYSSLDGVLFNKDQTELICYPAGKKESVYTIPETVIDIKSNAFYANSHISTLHIPEGVKYIGEHAFNDCSNLQYSFYIPRSVTHIGERIFSGNPYLGEITVHPENSFYFSEDGVLYDKKQKMLVRYPEGKKGGYTIPQGTTKIGYLAFENCVHLSFIELPEGLTHIDSHAFTSCHLIESIHLPSTLIAIGAYAFSVGNRFTSISVDERNPYYSSQDGILFNKDKTSICIYPSGKKEMTYAIPSTIKTIEEYAFITNMYLRSVDIPNSVTTIKQCAFSCVYNLTTVTIPASVTYIGHRAFSDSQLISVYAQNTTPPTCDLYAFDTVSDCTLYVPEGSKPLYQAAEGWNTFSSIQEGDDGRCVYLYAQGNGGGEVTPSGMIPCERGSDQTFFFYPHGNHALLWVMIDGKQNEEATNGYYTFKDIQESHTIEAYFQQITPSPEQYLINAEAGTGGSISPSGVVTIDKGESQTFVFEPAAGYHISRVLIDGTLNLQAAEEGSYTFHDVDKHHTISVSFTAQQYTIEASAGENGQITPSGTIKIPHGSNQNFVFIPNEGYYVADVWVNGVSNPQAVTTGSYTFAEITKNQTIVVSFAQYQYTIEALAGANGEISPSGMVGVPYGESRTFIFIPADGYSVSNVWVNGISNPQAVSDGVYTFSKVKKNQAIAVSFTQQQHTIVASAGANGKISPSGEIQIPHGTNQSFSIIPDEGYCISEVLINGINSPEAVASKQYTFVKVTTDQSIEVSFKLILKEEEKKDPVTTLQTLTVTNGRMIPEFSPEHLQYTVYLDCEAKQPDIQFTTSDVRVRSELTGNVPQSPGSHPVVVEVSYQTQTTTYTIDCIRPFPNVVIPLWDNMLTVINNPAHNGGHTFVGYQWYRDQEMNQPMAGETLGNLYLADDTNSNPDYTVWLTTSEGVSACGCRDESVLSRSERKVVVYPNPTQDLLMVENPNWEKSEIKLYNSTGVLLIQQPCKEYQSKVDLSNLPAGNYLIQVGHESIVVVKER